MATLKFSLNTSDDFKSLLLTDESSDLDLDIYTIKSITISTEIDGLWVDILSDKSINISNIQYPNELGGTPDYYNEGIVLSIPVEEIFTSTSDFIYDNIYTVTLTIEHESTLDILVDAQQKTFIPLSQWYKNNRVALYNYHDNDIDLMKSLLTYQTWINILYTASAYGDSGTIEVILKTFKRLIDGYRLPQ